MLLYLLLNNCLSSFLFKLRLCWDFKPSVSEIWLSALVAIMRLTSTVFSGTLLWAKSKMGLDLAIICMQDRIRGMITSRTCLILNSRYKAQDWWQLIAYLDDLLLYAQLMPGLRSIQIVENSKKQILTSRRSMPLWLTFAKNATLSRPMNNLWTSHSLLYQRAWPQLIWTISNTINTINLLISISRHFEPPNPDTSDAGALAYSVVNVVITQIPD